MQVLISLGDVWTFLFSFTLLLKFRPLTIKVMLRGHILSSGIVIVTWRSGRWALDTAEGFRANRTLRKQTWGFSCLLYSLSDEIQGMRMIVIFTDSHLPLPQPVLSSCLPPSPVFRCRWSARDSQKGEGQSLTPGCTPHQAMPYTVCPCLLYTSDAADES